MLRISFVSTWYAFVFIKAEELKGTRCNKGRGIGGLPAGRQGQCFKGNNKLAIVQNHLFNMLRIEVFIKVSLNNFMFIICKVY